MAEKNLVSFEDIAAAHERIKPHAVRTPVLSSPAVNERTGAQVFFKCENLQNMGAFKFRGAYNALSRLNRDDARRGVPAFSSGNQAPAAPPPRKTAGTQTPLV